MTTLSSVLAAGAAVPGAAGAGDPVRVAAGLRELIGQANVVPTLPRVERGQLVDPLSRTVANLLDLDIADLLRGAYVQASELYVAGAESLAKGTRERVPLAQLGYEWSWAPVLEVLVNGARAFAVTCTINVYIGLEPVAATVEHGCLVGFDGAAGSVEVELLVGDATGDGRSSGHARILQFGTAIDTRAELDLSRRGGIPLVPGARCADPTQT